MRAWALASVPSALPALDRGGTYPQVRGELLLGPVGGLADELEDVARDAAF